MMVSNFFKALLPKDLDAIVAYLRSVPPVRNVVAAPVYRLPTKHDACAEAERGFSERDMQDTVRRGAYLATIGHCLECHTPMDKGALLLDTALGRRPAVHALVRQGPARKLEGSRVAQRHLASRQGPGRLEPCRDQARHCARRESRWPGWPKVVLTRNTSF